MADKRISQLVDRGTVANSDVVPIVVSGAVTTNKATISSIQTFMQGNLDLGVTSVGLAMPSAFTVTGSPVTASGNISVVGAGTVSQYIRGDGSLADFPQGGGGGGASVNYYLNGSVSQGTIGGIAYREINKTPILGAGTDFTISSNGYIASFITDAGDPALLEIPAGNWNFETYLQASSGGGSPTFYIELYKVNSGGTATLIASNSGTPELISLGTNINPYFSALAVPTTTLALTDRLALRYYVTPAGRTITLHTENSHLCQIITTFTTGLTALNGLTAQVQNFATGSSGTDFGIVSAGTTHTFNIPDASATARGLVTTGTQTIAGSKTFTDDAVINGVNVGRGASSISTNTRFGSSALSSNTTGSSNTAVGDLALQYNTTGSGNTALGRTSLRNCTTGNFNTAVGSALSAVTSGDSNSGIGWNSGLNTTTGIGNSSLGAFSLQNNTTASNNTAIGYYAMQNNITGGNNTAVGLEALRYNTAGGRNTSVGDYSMITNTTGSFNTAIGGNALSSNTTGEYNVALGTYALHKNTTGSYNIAIGDVAGSDTIPGDNIISNNSIFIGHLTEALANNQTNQIVIGHNAKGNGSNTVTIGNSSITNTYLRGTVQLTDTGTASSINIISDSTGNGAINIEKNTNGTGIRVTNNGIGQGIFANNSSTGTGILIGNTSTGKGLYIDNASGATGDPFVYSLGGAAFVKAKIDSQGNITGNSFIKSSGTSAQFLKADGSVDSSTYLTTGSAASTYLPLTGGILTGGIFIQTAAPSVQLRAANGSNAAFILANSSNTHNWTFESDFGAAGQQGELRIRNSILGSNAINISTSNVVTLTGALNGTSASFGGQLTMAYGGTPRLILQDTDSGAGNVGILFKENTTDKWTIASVSNSLLFFNEQGAGAGLTLSSTNAATFSSSVTAGDLISTSYGSARIQVNSTTNSANSGFRLGAKDSSGTTKNAGLYYTAGTTTANTYLALFADDNNPQLTVLANGNVGIGTASPTTKTHIIGSASTGGVLRIENNQNQGDVNHGTINIVNTATHAIGNDASIMFSAFAADVSMHPRASIGMKVSSSTVAGDLVFNTRDNTTFAERMRITSVGNTQPGADNAYSLGVSGTRWSAVWAANGTIQTSDEREKKDIVDSDLGLDLITKLRPVSFKWKVGQNIVTSQVVKDEEGNPILDEEGNEKTESVLIPREGKRTHYGLIAQEVEEVLDGKDFGGFIHDEETDTKGLRYDQFVPLLIKSIQELNDKIAILESKLK